MPGNREVGTRIVTRSGGVPGLVFPCRMALAVIEFDPLALGYPTQAAASFRRRARPRRRGGAHDVGNRAVPRQEPVLIAALRLSTVRIAQADSQ
jgi:hypothetical protein